MFDAEKGLADRLDGRKLAIGIVQARFNENVTNALADACRQELATLGVDEKNIRHVKVPGALEVASALQVMAETDKFDTPNSSSTTPWTTQLALRRRVTMDKSWFMFWFPDGQGCGQ